MKVKNFTQSSILDIKEINIMAYITEINNLKHQDDCKWTCDKCSQEKTTKYVAAKKNYAKNNETHICRDCFMKLSNPAKKENRKTNALSKKEQKEMIDVNCSCCSSIKNISKLAYRKNIELNGPYTCKSCAQKDKIISEEQKEKISQTLTGRKLTDEHKKNIGLGCTEEQKQSLRDNGWYTNHDYHPFTGHHHSEEAKQKISESNTGKVRTEEMKVNYSIGRNKLMKRQGGLKEETKQKLSSVMVKKISAGEWNPNNHFKHEIRSVGGKCKNKGNTICLKSSYESKACDILDNENYYTMYVYEPFSIEYINSSGNKRSYIPDFMVQCEDKGILMIEIKPNKLLERIEDNLLKQESLISFCKDRGWKYELWTEEKLEK